MISAVTRHNVDKNLQKKKLLVTINASRGNHFNPHLFFCSNYSMVLAQTQLYLEHMPKMMSLKNVWVNQVRQIYRLYRVHRWADSEQKNQHAVWLRYNNNWYSHHSKTQHGVHWGHNKKLKTI